MSHVNIGGGDKHKVSAHLQVCDSLHAESGLADRKGVMKDFHHRPQRSRRGVIDHALLARQALHRRDEGFSSSTSALS
jgi:hypothetical protein